MVDGKYFSKNIDVKEVEKFIGMLNDCGVHKGLLITQEGYSDAAIERAYNDPLDVELDILNFKELQQFQAFGAIPYAGNHGALVPAPFGWVIDAQQYGFALATIYQRGLSLEQAQKNNEWMYVNYWNRNDDEASNLQELLELQADKIKESFPDAEITYQKTIKRDNYETSLRKSMIETYPAPEYTGFIEFENFIFFCTLFSPVALESKNIRKLEHILSKAMPIKMKESE